MSEEELKPFEAQAPTVTVSLHIDLIRVINQLCEAARQDYPPHKQYYLVCALKEIGIDTSEFDQGIDP